MNRDEMNTALERGEELGIVLYDVQPSPEVKLKRFVSLCKKTPKNIHHYSWHYLQENPSFVLEQKCLKDKPYFVSIGNISTVPELWDNVEIYFATLDDISDFLQQFGKELTDFDHFSKDEFSL